MTAEDLVETAQEYSRLYDEINEQQKKIDILVDENLKRQKITKLLKIKMEKYVGNNIRIKVIPIDSKSIVIQFHPRDDSCDEYISIDIVMNTVRPTPV